MQDQPENTTPFSDSQLLRVVDVEKYTIAIADLPGLSEAQRASLTNFAEATGRLIRHRANLHLASMKFSAMSVLATDLTTIQHDVYYCTEAYFHSFYATLSQLANVAHRFPPSFNGIKKGSNEAFLRGLAKDAPSEVQASVATLEQARQHRAFIDHPVSNQVSHWLTTTTGDERIITVSYFGEFGANGSMPLGAEEGGISDWYKQIPSYFDIEPALKIVITYVCGKILEALYDNAGE